MRLSSLPAAVCLCAAALFAGQLGPPKVGFVRLPDGSVRPVYGLHANFVLGKALVAHSESATFSDKGGLIFADGAIQLVDPAGVPIAVYATAEPQPVLNIEAGLQTAVAWLPSQHSLLRWNGSVFTCTEVPGQLEGAVTSVQLQSQSTARLVASLPDGQVTEAVISLPSGNLLSVAPVPYARGKAFAVGNFILFSGNSGLEIQSPDGSRRNLPLVSSDVTAVNMATGWLHLTSARTGQSWALHLNANTVELSELPTKAVN